MSRIGKSVIQMPKGVSITVSKGNMVVVKGPKGELMQQINPDIAVSEEDGNISLVRATEQKRHKSLHGLYNSLIRNMVKGVSQGFEKQLELVGVGYRAANAGNLLDLSLGYSHPIMFYIPDEIKVEALMEKGKNPIIKLEGIDNQLLGQVAAKIRAFRKPEPYKGKGVRFVGEEIRRKAGKTAAK